MKIEQIAIQLYTLRNFTTNRADFAATLKRVRDIGYHAVELAGTAGIDPAEVAIIARDAGLKICASHEAPLENPQQVVERLGELGVDYAVYSYPAGFDLSVPAQVDRLIAALEYAGSELRRAGIALCYHHHAHEYIRHGGCTVLEEIFSRTSPQHLQAELDIHWIQAGGGDPAETCRSFTGRLPLLHVKDYTVTADGERAFAEVGYGNLNIPEIVAAAEFAGCRWFIVEQDICPGDPFDCIARSFEFLRKLASDA